MSDRMIHSAYDVEPVTPSDTTDLQGVQGPYSEARGLYIQTTSGDICVVTKAGNERTITLPKQQVFPIQVTRVKATGTTAVGILALY